MASRPEIDFRRIVSAGAASIRMTFIDHVPLYVCMVVFAAFTAALLKFYPLPFPFDSGEFFLSAVGEAFLLAGAIAALIQLVALYREGGPKSPLTVLATRLLGTALSGDRFGNIVHGLIALTPMIMIFTALKIEIPRIHAFSWDTTFMQIGAAAGFGRPLWEVLQPLLGHPPITVFFSFAYATWFPVLFGCLFWQLSAPRSAIRSQYLLAFCLAWFFGGFVIATIFSSAGPCFYDHFVSGPNPYSPLLHYLHTARQHWPIWTVDAQDKLWQAYLTGKGDIQGISAMPSMHVIVTTLMTLLGWKVSRRVGIAFTVFSAVIFVGTIMLGWHYFVDDVAGVGLAFVFWATAGRITSAWTAYSNRPAPAATRPAIAVVEA